MKNNNKKITVTTISGKKADIELCKLIKNEYYLVGDINIEHSGDCYYMESSNKYVRITSDLIVYDHFQCKYIYKNSKPLQKGVVRIADDGTLVIGYFSYKRLYLLPIIYNKDYKNYYCVNDDILKNQNYYKEELATGDYHHISNKNAIAFTKKVNCNYDEKRNLSYSVDSDLLNTYSVSYKEGFNTKPSTFIEKHGDFTKDFTYGLEFETTKGFVPNRLCRKLGLIPLRDGSIEGLEYVTIPLSKKKGLQTVSDICNELKNRTEHDSNCSLHLHIGGIPRTESYILALYKILYLIQDDMFSMFSIIKKDNRGYRKKHYTKPLNYSDVMINLDKVITEDNIKENFNYLFRYLSMGYEYKSYNNNLNDVAYHPSDPQGKSKWNIKSRYNWVNLIPLIFGNKETVEFRVHNATNDSNEVILYMAICSYILEYVKKYEKEILANERNFNTLTLINLIKIETEYSKFGDILVRYIKDRQSFISSELRYKHIIPNYSMLKSRAFNDINYINRKDNINEPIEYYNERLVVAREENRDLNVRTRAGLINEFVEFNTLTRNTDVE